MDSYVRPAKLFTADQALIVAEVGRLKPDVLDRALDTVVSLLKPIV
jgi:hypothetical protein